MRARNVDRIMSLLLVAGAVVPLVISQKANAEPPGIPCAGRAKAIIANTGQSMHNSGTVVDGNVQCAGSIVIHPGAVINGTWQQYTPAGLAIVPAPATAIDKGWMNVDNTVTLSAGDYKANGININSGGKLQVTGGQVRIWVSGGVNVNALANQGGVPKNLQILLTGTSGVNINSGGQLYGLIYSPQGPVNVNATVFGSVVGSQVTLNSGGSVHFDESWACPTCAPSCAFSCCEGVCTSTASDANNCGACGHACPAMWACELGTCIPPSSCQPSNAPSAVASGANVFVYEPLGSWSENVTGVKRFQVEPVASPPAVTIATPGAVNACSANAATKVVVCTESDNDVHIINPSGGLPGTTVSTSLVDGATGTQYFSGGWDIYTAGVAMDPVNNRAVLAVGVAPGGRGGFQMLNLTTLAFSSVIPAPLDIQTSEAILIDPLRNLVLSPNEQNHYVVLNTATSTVYDMPITMPVGVGLMDSAAEDCSTGIALASVEFSGQLVLVNLNGASYSGATWNAPHVVSSFPEFESLSEGTCGIAVDSRSHLGLVTGELGGAGFGVIQLPSTPPAAGVTPALLDYVRADVPPVASEPWQMGEDPHSTAVYSSPSSNKPFGVIPNQARSHVAVIDMQALLAAPRVPGTHTAQTPLPSGVVRFVQ